MAVDLNFAPASVEIFKIVLVYLIFLHFYFTNSDTSSAIGICFTWIIMVFHQFLAILVQLPCDCASKPTQDFGI